MGNGEWARLGEIVPIGFLVAVGNVRRVGRMIGRIHPFRSPIPESQLLSPTPRLSNCNAMIVNPAMNTSITTNAPATDTSLMPSTP